MKRRTFITLLAVGSAAACARPAHATIRGLTMGTSYTVELAAPIAVETAVRHLQRCSCPGLVRFVLRGRRAFDAHRSALQAVLVAER